jgi:hypothetical protein
MLKQLLRWSFLGFLLVFVSSAVFAVDEDDKSPWAEKTFAGLKLRNVGPALMSGRIADIAIHPNDNNLWYVAVGSGGVWKTENSGITWAPIFDDQTSYSIGCVTIDPGNPHVVWVGTGENVGGRHVGYGDGVYRSQDGGASWENRGLKESQHVSKIIVHPGHSNIIWVAAQGPLWSKGGERGLYKSTDDGTTWKKVLGDDAWVGVTDFAIDARNPDWMYAATWQRHRNVASYMGAFPNPTWARLASPFHPNSPTCSTRPLNSIAEPAPCIDPPIEVARGKSNPRRWPAEPARTTTRNFMRARTISTVSIWRT